MSMRRADFAQLLIRATKCYQFLPDFIRIRPTTGLTLPDVHAQKARRSRCDGGLQLSWRLVARCRRWTQRSAILPPVPINRPCVAAPSPARAGRRRAGQVWRLTQLVAGAVLLFGCLVLVVGSICRSATAR